MTTTELIERLEKATGRDIDLNREIGRLYWSGWDKHPAPLMGCPEYTDSIDAALTLVPEGCMMKLDQYLLNRTDPSKNLWRVWLKYISATDEVLDVFSGTRPTPAIALCIAALKAREAMETVK